MIERMRPLVFGALDTRSYMQNEVTNTAFKCHLAFDGVSLSILPYNWGGPDAVARARFRVDVDASKVSTSSFCDSGLDSASCFAPTEPEVIAHSFGATWRGVIVVRGVMYRSRENDGRIVGKKTNSLNKVAV